jgi:hypothetical protein
MKFYAVIGEHAFEFRSVVAEKWFYEQRGKPVIIEIDGQHQRQQNGQRQREEVTQHQQPRRSERSPGAESRTIEQAGSDQGLARAGLEIVYRVVCRSNSRSRRARSCCATTQDFDHLK